MDVVRYLWSQLKVLVTPFNHIFRDFVERSRGSRSSVVSPFQWIIAMLLAVGVASLLVKGPVWLTKLFLISGFVGAILLFIICIICLVRKPDLLRSEQFELTKMAIEKRIIGTSDTGLIEPNTLNPPKLDSDSDLTKKVE